jgi:methionyl-tRNA formyltransferase
MNDDIEIVFLGVSSPGLRIYNWLCDRDDVFVHSILTTREQLSVIEDVRPDYVVSCAFEHIIPERFLRIPSEGCLNLHPSYLPYNRGRYPNVWNVIDDIPVGVTIHYMEPKVDTGDIVARRAIETDFSDSGRSLSDRLGNEMVELFKEVWPDVVAGNVSPTSQDPDESTFHHTSELQDLCKLDPDEEVRVETFLDRLRALDHPSLPKAEIEVDGETYSVAVDIVKKET